MLIKVCGLTDEKNLKAIANLNIDMIGLNFYPSSKRYLGENERFAALIPEHIENVGVFVDEEFEKVRQIAEKHKLDYLQLHGNETPEYCKRMQKFTRIIKAFGITKDTNIDKQCRGYEMCDFFLFDTKTPLHGGSGKKFDWDILQTYSASIPFLLSGGIKPKDYVEIKKIEHTMLIGVDVNSKFEISPGYKDVKLLHSFVENLRII
jgi:phosphoribosylanthranilate isomerase